MALNRYHDIQTALGQAGLLARGGFQVGAGDAVPPLSDGRPTQTVIMTGNAGPAMWEAFAAAGSTGPDPLDRWSRSVLESIADQYDAEVMMPSDGPPYMPFQRWAMRAEPVYPSPLGILIHPKWGLWHGYRGALLFAIPLDVPKRETPLNPCEACDEKPCLTTCPVDAFTGSNYRVEACAAHLRTPIGKTCLTGGCLARRACPVAIAAHPSPNQAAFHMNAFLSSRPK